MKFCSNCGKPLEHGIPQGDQKERFFCTNCHTVHYENPRMIVGCIPIWEDKVLLLKRANEPGKDLWTLPAGFLENEESVEEGALRETREEANAEVEIMRLFSVYSVPHIGQVYLFFLARLNNLDFHPGVESLQLQLFSGEDIPWDEIAFSSVRFTLEKFFERSGDQSVHTGAYGKHTVR